MAVQGLSLPLLNERWRVSVAASTAVLPYVPTSQLDVDNSTWKDKPAIPHAGCGSTRNDCRVNGFYTRGESVHSEVPADIHEAAGYRPQASVSPAQDIRRQTPLPGCESPLGPVDTLAAGCRLCGGHCCCAAGTRNNRCSGTAHSTDGGMRRCTASKASSPRSLS